MTLAEHPDDVLDRSDELRELAAMEGDEITESTTDPSPVFDGPPIPLTRTSIVPPFPADALPDTYAAMVAAVAVATQTDPAMAGTSALSVLSTCTGGHAEIKVRRGWTEPLNLYTATIAGPGERKSAVQHTMVAPVMDVEAELAESGTGAKVEADTLKQIAMGDAERAKRAASNATSAADKQNLQADAVGAALAAEAITVPAVPRLVADDVTPEAAASLLAEQNGRLAVISAEGGIFDIIGGRYSGNVPNMDLWLKAHAGDPLKVDRKGREPEYIRKPALTLGLMIQPAVLTAIAGNAAFRGRGFLARFLYARPVSKVGARTIAPPPVPAEVQDAYRAAVTDLAHGMVGWTGDPAILTLTAEADLAVQHLEAAVEPTLAEGGELAALADWGSKYVGAVVRIAGMLHLAEHGADRGVRTPVEAITIAAARRVGNYFKAAAIAVFAEMGTDDATSDAVYLLSRLERMDGATVSERDLHQASRSRFKVKADMMPALNRLVEHEYLARMPPPERTGGRPKAPEYHVNQVLSQRSQHSQALSVAGSESNESCESTPALGSAGVA